MDFQVEKYMMGKAFMNIKHDFILETPWMQTENP